MLLPKRIKREQVPRHLVCVDTSILWHKDKAHVVNPEFTAFWSDSNREFNLVLCVPEVVRGELLFQQTTSALKALEAANAQLERVSAVTGKQYSHRILETRVRNEVQDRLDRSKPSTGRS